MASGITGISQRPVFCSLSSQPLLDPNRTLLTLILPLLLQVSSNNRVIIFLASRRGTRICTVMMLPQLPRFNWLLISRQVHGQTVITGVPQSNIKMIPYTRHSQLKSSPTHFFSPIFCCSFVRWLISFWWKAVKNSRKSWITMKNVYRSYHFSANSVHHFKFPFSLCWWKLLGNSWKIPVHDEAIWKLFPPKNL